MSDLTVSQVPHVDNRRLLEATFKEVKSIGKNVQTTDARVAKVEEATEATQLRIIASTLVLLITLLIMELVRRNTDGVYTVLGFITVASISLMAIFVVYVITAIVIKLKNDVSGCIRRLHRFCKLMVVIQGVFMAGIVGLHIKYGNESSYFESFVTVMSTLTIACFTILSIIYKIGISRIERQVNGHDYGIPLGYQPLPGAGAGAGAGADAGAAPGGGAGAAPGGGIDKLREDCIRCFCCCFCCGENRNVQSGNNTQRSINGPGRVSSRKSGGIRIEDHANAANERLNVSERKDAVSGASCDNEDERLNVSQRKNDVPRGGTKDVSIYEEDDGMQQRGATSSPAAGRFDEIGVEADDVSNVFEANSAMG